MSVTSAIVARHIRSSRASAASGAPVMLISVQPAVGVVRRLRAGGEPRAVDDDHRPAEPYAVGLRQSAGEAGAVGIGERQVDRTALDEGPLATGGAVDQLVGHHQVARRDLVAETADRAR